jgi:hypothetical protein
MKRCALPFIKALQCRLIQAIDSRLGSPIHFIHCAGAHFALSSPSSSGRGAGDI